jgi:hypothetical protein
MARLIVDGRDLVVRLAWWERLVARRGDVRVPLRAVREVTLQPDWWRALRGLRGRGLWIPGAFCVGVRSRGHAADFVAFRPGAGPVVCVEFFPSRSPFARVAVGARNPEATAAAIRRALPEAEADGP